MVRVLPKCVETGEIAEVRGWSWGYCQADVFARRRPGFLAVRPFVDALVFRLLPVVAPFLLRAAAGFFFTAALRFGPAPVFEPCHPGAFGFALIPGRFFRYWPV